MRTIAALILTLALSVAARAEPACEEQRFENTPFVVCSFDTRTGDLELVIADAAGTPYRTFERLAGRPEAPRIRFAMNAGMFDDDGRPVGLYIEQGKLVHQADNGPGAGNFHLKPNGVFSMDRHRVLRVETTEAFEAAGRKPVWATQSGPMLVIGGQLHPAIQPDGPSRVIRNGVGVRDAHTAVFVISGEPVSFGRLARFFRDRLHCANALYFDGVVSSLWWPAGKRRDSGALIGPMAVVLDRAH